MSMMARSNTLHPRGRRYVSSLIRCQCVTTDGERPPRSARVKALRPPAAVRYAQPGPVLAPRPGGSYATKDTSFVAVNERNLLRRHFLLDGGVQIRVVSRR